MDRGQARPGTSALTALLADCTLQVIVDGEPRGTGFLVAPGLVLTCSHVVDSGRNLAVLGRVVKGPAEVCERTSPDYPDLALLAVPGGPHPCVLLDVRYAPGHDFYGWGFARYGTSRPRSNMESLFGRIEGWSWEENDPARELIKLTGAQVVPGASGSPILNIETGGVCGVLSETRSEGTNLGGYAVPVSVALGIWTDRLTMPHNQFHRQDVRWFEALAARGRRADGDQALRQIHTSLDALAARVGSLPPGSRAEAATESRRRWTHLYSFKFLPRDFATHDEVSKSLMKIFFFVGLGVKEQLAGSRYDQFTFLCRLNPSPHGDRQVPMLEILTHRPELVRAGFRAYRTYLEELFGLPDEPAHFAERAQALHEIHGQLEARVEGWVFNNTPGIGSSYQAVRATGDGEARAVTFTEAPSRTNVADYRESVTTTSEALEFLVSLLEAPLVVEFNMQTPNLALLNLMAAVMDKKEIDFGRVLFNVDYPEQWSYEYDPSATSE